MNRKAFTLIELVAVLVILGVVSLIVAPLILNMIRNVKESTNKRSVDGYGRAVEYAMSNYQLKHLKYPDIFDELDIDYSGNKVECKTSRINPDYSIYLSECKVNGRLVKNDKEIDGYYHYGILKMTNQEYVDTYGKNLEDALKSYHDEHNEYPSDYTSLELPPLDKDVSCEVSINYDGTVYLNNCKVDNEDVLDDNNEVYIYGNLYATTNLLKKTNSKSITIYTDGNTHEMYTFNHEATGQTPALTDYRYIGNEPYNYVKFNGDELWRIIGIFETDDGTGNYEKRIKLIRNDSIGTKQWNSTNANEWIGSTMQIYLNDDYEFDTTSLSMIENVKWYLGGLGNPATSNGEQFYIAERSLNTSSTDRSKNWTQKIALMYPSDYGYTYALGVGTCYSRLAECHNRTPSSGWLYNDEYIQWLLTPSSVYTDMVFQIKSSGAVNYGYSRRLYSLKPTVYLNFNVNIIFGDGTIDNPYEFEL